MWQQASPVTQNIFYSEYKLEIFSEWGGYNTDDENSHNTWYPLAARGSPSMA